MPRMRLIMPVASIRTGLSVRTTGQVKYTSPPPPPVAPLLVICVIENTRGAKSVCAYVHTHWIKPIFTSYAGVIFRHKIVHTHVHALANIKGIRSHAHLMQGHPLDQTFSREAGSPCGWRPPKIEWVSHLFCLPFFLSLSVSLSLSLSLSRLLLFLRNQICFPSYRRIHFIICNAGERELQRLFGKRC